jgi:hypothetical protein
MYAGVFVSCSFHVKAFSDEHVTRYVYFATSLSQGCLRQAWCSFEMKIFVAFSYIWRRGGEGWVGVGFIGEGDGCAGGWVRKKEIYRSRLGMSAKM